MTIDDFLRLVGPIYAELLYDAMLEWREHGLNYKPKPKELVTEAVQQALDLYSAAAAAVRLYEGDEDD